MKHNRWIAGRSNRLRIVGIGCAMTFAAVPHLSHAATVTATPGNTVAVDQELRLETVGYRLRLANASRCETPEMLTGMILHDIGGYSANTRAALSGQFGLTYGFGVRKFVPDSAADRAGLRPQDEILAVNGQDLREFAVDSIGRKASYDRTGRFVTLLSNALRQGPATLHVRRGNTELDVMLTGELGCGGGMVLIESPQFNAWSDGSNTAVTTRMMQIAGSDDELAFVVSHEMAHNILHHAQKLARKSSLLAEFGIGSRKIKRSEIEADTLAMNLMDRAGFDLDAPERFLRRAAPLQVVDLAITHPGISRRIEIARSERDRMLGRNNTRIGLGTLALAYRRAPNASVTIRRNHNLVEWTSPMGGSLGPNKAALLNAIANLAIAPSIAAKEKISSLLLWNS